MIRFFQQDTRIMKVIFWVIIVVSCAAMVIFLVPGLFEGQTAASDTYATIGHGGFLGRFLPAEQSVSTTDVRNLAQRYLERQGLPDQLLPFMMPRVAEGLIQQDIELQQAKRLGITATDSDVRRYLHTGQWGMLLFPNGKYIGDAQYAEFVSQQFQMTRDKFENEIKKEIIETRLRALITGGVTVSDNDVRSFYTDQATKIKFDYAVIDSASLRNQINPTDAQLQAWFKQNASKYEHAVPEGRKIQYIAFTTSDLPQAPAPVTDAEVQQYYQQHLANYQVEAQVKVRHILIAVNSKNLTPQPKPRPRAFSTSFITAAISPSSPRRIPMTPAASPREAN